MVSRYDLTQAEEECAPEASLLSVPIRRKTALPQAPADGLFAAWEEARRSGRAVDRETLRQSLRDHWHDCFDLHYCDVRQRFLMSPVSGMPRQIASLLDDGEDMAVVIDRINHIATQNCHVGEAVVGLALFGEDDGATDFLTLVPLAAQNGIVTHYLGTLRP